MLVMGLYLKTHTKKTDEEVLDHFGARGESLDSNDDELLLEKEKKSDSKRSDIFGPADAPQATSPIGGALGLFAGGLKSGVSTFLFEHKSSIWLYKILETYSIQTNHYIFKSQIG